MERGEVDAQGDYEKMREVFPEAEAIIRADMGQLQVYFSFWV